MAALRRMLTGDIKKQVDLNISKIVGYDQLRSIVMNWAVDRKLERDKKDDPMDIDAVRAHTGWENDESWLWDTSPNDDWPEAGQDYSGDETHDVNSIGKGGNGNGKGGKSKGTLLHLDYVSFSVLFAV